MNDLDELERTLIAAARRGFTPSADEGVRVRSRALSAAAAGALVSYPAPGLGTRLKGSAIDALEALENPASRGRILLGVLALGGAGVGGYALGLRAGRSEAQAERAVATAPLALPAPPAASGSGTPQPEPATSVAEPVNVSRLAAPHRASAEPIASAAPPSDPEVELRALRRIERVLREHNPRLAVALLEELERDVPDGKLLEERAAARSVARCELDDASAATDFAARHPNSVYLQRVVQACERINPAPETDSKQ